MESTNHDALNGKRTNKGDERSPSQPFCQSSLVQQVDFVGQLNSQPEVQPPVLPPLQTILQAVSYMPAHIRYGRRNDGRRSPVSKALTMLYGCTWTVSVQKISWLTGSGKNARCWEWRTPQDYVQVLSGIDASDWREGQPQTTITIADFTSMLRCVIAHSKDDDQRVPIRGEERGKDINETS